MDEKNIANDASTSSSHHDDTGTHHVVEIYGDGIIGCIERIPISCKLSKLIISLSCAFIAVGIIILVRFAQDISEAKTRGTLLDIAISIGTLNRDLQLERLAAAQYISSGYVDLAGYQDAINATDMTISTTYRSLKKYKLPPGRVLALKTNINSIYSLRNDTMNKLSQTFVSYRYGLCIKALLNLLSFFPSQVRDSNLLHSYSEFNRILEVEYGIQTAGISTGKELRTPADRYRGYVKFAGVSDDNLDNWKQFTPKEISDLYTSLIPISVTDSLYRMTEAALLKTDAAIYPVGNSTEFRINVNPANFTLSSWVGNYTYKMNALDKVNTAIEKSIISDARKELRVAVIWIVCVIILISILVSALSLIASALVYTIIHPWKRLNAVQDILISRYVPEHILRILNVANISKIETGKSTSFSVVMIAIRIREESTDIISTLNTHIGSIGPTTDVAHGFFIKHEGDTIIICVPKVKKAIPLIGVLLKGPYDLAIHRTTLQIGAVGYVKYMGFVMLGPEANVCSDLIRVLSKTNSHVLVTETMSKNLPIPLRYVGVLSHDMPIKIYERFGQHQKDISNLNIKEISSLSSIYTDDQMIQLYHQRYRFLCDRHSNLISRMRLYDILADPTLKAQFMTYLRECKVSEILDLYEDLSRCTDVSAYTQNIYNIYLKKDAAKYVALPQHLQDIKDMNQVPPIISILMSSLEGYVILFKQSSVFSYPMNDSSDIMSLI